MSDLQYNYAPFDVSSQAGHRTSPVQIMSDSAAKRHFTSTCRSVRRLMLRICAGPDEGRELCFDFADWQAARALRGGRSAVNDIILNDAGVSNAHFDLDLRAGRVLLRDLDSDEGLTMGGFRVREAWLAAGDVFCAGTTVIQVLAVDTVDVPLALTDHFGPVYGRSQAMRALFSRLAALTERGDQLSILITGELGTGKELVARGLHAASMRTDRPFVVHDCAQVPIELTASRLFGHAREAVPGTISDQRGCFEAADGGTLYLKNIDELPLTLQSQLYRVMQEGVITRMGEHHARRVNVRVICATHRDLRRQVAEGKFRPELYFRVAGAALELPALRDREDDLEYLAEHFLKRLNASEGRTRRFSEDALAGLRAHPWPDNVLGLWSAVERSFFASDGETISRAELGLGKSFDGSLARRLAGIEVLFGVNHVEAVAGFERLYFRHLLKTHPSKAKATRTSGMTHEGFRLALRRLKLASHPPTGKR